MILERIERHELVLQGLTGCRTGESAVVLRKVRSFFPELEVQLVRADRIAGSDHLLLAARGAIRAFRQHRERAHTLAVELLLYTSCQRQISKAIQLLGVGPQTRDVVLTAFADTPIQDDFVGKAARVLHGTQDDKVLEISSKKKLRQLMKTYNVSRVEMEAAKLPSEQETSVLKRLIIERSALLAVQK